MGDAKEAVKEALLEAFMDGVSWGESRTADRLEARAAEIEAEGGSIFAGATVAELRQQAKNLWEMMKKGVE